LYFSLAISRFGLAPALMLFFGHLDWFTNPRIKMSLEENKKSVLSRRKILKGIGLAPLMLRPSPLFGGVFSGSPAAVGSIGRPGPLADQVLLPSFADARLRPHYPLKSRLADVLRLVPAGSDEYLTEKYAFEIDLLLKKWAESLQKSSADQSLLKEFLSTSLVASPLESKSEETVRTGFGIEVIRRSFKAAEGMDRDQFLNQAQLWLASSKRVETAEFEIFNIETLSSSPLTVRASIRYDIVTTRSDQKREERIGFWQTEWSRAESGTWTAHRWEAGEENLAVATGPGFIDVTAHALGAAESYGSQLLHGVDYWRTVLDGACGIDLYSNNGVAAGDFDQDGFDDFYVCQPAGLPNRLYRNRGDGTFEDVTEKAGVGVLDNTACALFADFDNRGLQDLLVVTGSGPLLFVNQGNSTFSLKLDAFKFSSPPQGTFTHASVADYDGDGRLDVYFCTYMYYLGLDQYHYPIPYFDARNGPPNCLLHNEGNGTFVERTESAGLNVENNRYSFACAWGESTSNGLPDLCVVNDFGKSQLYRNLGNGKFAEASRESGIEDVGAGMSAAWCDFDNDGHQDIYIPSMWEAAGQRVSGQKQFHAAAPEDIRVLYQRHAQGNALYRNLGDGRFANIGKKAGVDMGRWSWSSDFWDFDHDGYPDLYVSNGYISAPNRNDLASFFWRQVVGKSPEDATGSVAYEHGWNAINELIRSDNSWNGYERNCLFANNRDGTFSDVSGILGMGFIEDSRSFALADIDHDGRLEVILKNRNAPQLRILHNGMKEIGNSIAFRLRGTRSNRDAIGTAVTVETGELKQTRYLQAGTGFLAQHSKEIFFGVGKSEAKIQATIRWPSGLSQHFENLPVDHRIQVEEGSSSFGAEAFTAVADNKIATPAALESLPIQVETWLLEPLKAPEFSLPDLDGKVHRLLQSRGNSVLLHFWAGSAAVSREQLQLLQRNRARIATGTLQVLAVNVDQETDLARARQFATQEAFFFPVLFATEAVAGIYNIIYRYLFDRRRDLAIPTSFLLDSDGMIVKVYQGPIDIGHLLSDLESIPTTPDNRMKKAMPFKGELFQGGFHRNDFTYGVAMFQYGYLDQAAESFQQVLAAKPDNPDAYYNLGTLNLQRHDLKQARQYLEQTIKLRKNYPEAWNNLGMIAAQEGRGDEAIQNFQQSLQFRPAYTTALLNLGNLYRRQGAFAKAEENLGHAIELQPDDPEVLYSLGMLNAQQEKLAPAADYLRKAIALRPDYPEALNNLGVLFVRQNDYAEAEEQFRTCIHLVPGFDQSYINLARVYAIQGDKAKAREALQDLLRLQPENPAAKQAMEILK
jgi:Flp pilus assembly protein TadD/peroxiredoxin